MHSRTPRGGLSGRAGLLLVPAAALVVHQLRFMLAYGSRAGAELSSQGHSYLHSLVPWVVLALGAGLTAFLRRAVHATRTGDAGRLSGVSPVVLWAVTSAGLVAIYAVQESLEELFATGHPTGLAGIFGHGGLWAVPAAAVVSVAVVALLRIGRAVLRLAVRLAPGQARTARPHEARVPVGLTLVLPAPLARAAAGRAPPKLLPVR